MKLFNSLLYHRFIVLINFVAKTIFYSADWSIISIFQFFFQIKMKNLIIPNESNYKCVLGKVGEVKCIKEKISSFQKELMQYKKLPPNFSEAREVLANVGKEIQELDKQICDRILNDEDHK